MIEVMGYRSCSWLRNNTWARLVWFRYWCRENKGTICSRLVGKIKRCSIVHLTRSSTIKWHDLLHCVLSFETLWFQQRLFSFSLSEIRLWALISRTLLTLPRDSLVIDKQEQARCKLCQDRIAFIDQKGHPLSILYTSLEDHYVDRNSWHADDQYDQEKCVEPGQLANEGDLLEMFHVDHYEIMVVCTAIWVI